MKEEKLFRAIGDVGSDLIDMAEKETFPPSRWRRWGSIAACLAVLAGLTALVLPYLTGGISTADQTADSAAPSVMAESTPAETALEGDTETATTDSAEADIQEETDLDGIRDRLTPAQQKEQLVFQGVVYYVEALYSEDEAQTSLGEPLGTVEDADDEAYVGAAVYAKSGSDVRDTDGLPLEIFAETEDGFLYCLTYYASAGAYCTYEEAVKMCAYGDADGLLQRFVGVFENMPAFSDPSELTADQLIMYFLLALNQQDKAGYRSQDLYSYLWFQPLTDLPEDSIYAENGGCYVIPLEAITEILDQYLDGYTLDPSELIYYRESYDTELNALVLSRLLDLSDLTLDIQNAVMNRETQTLYLSVAQFEDESRKSIVSVRQYIIRFENDCFYYDSIITLSNGRS